MNGQRPPAVAGAFYPGTAARVRSALDGLLGSGAPTRERVPGALVPHAGWAYSGAVAAEVYRRIEIPATVLLLGPNHTGLGAEISVWSGDAWRTPAGDAAIDEDLRDAILRLAPGAEADRGAHEREHSLEVQVPFLLRIRPDVRIVPVAIAPAPAARLVSLGEGLAKALKAANAGDPHPPGPALILISSDMDHFHSHEEVLRIDAPALSRLEALDPVGLLEACERDDIGMCGVHPAVAGMSALRALGATRGEILAHKTSRDAGGDADRTVGYAAVLFR
ncbi:MAG: AmmeMemoRadiSam system protein B [Planctomycetota bacterium]